MDYMNLIKLFKPSEKALEGTVTVSDKSLSKGSMALQIVLLMEQYIRDNSNTVLSTGIEDYGTLCSEYNKLCQLDLGNTKNARIIKEKIDNFSISYQNKLKAENLIKFIKSLRNHFGKNTVLISTEQFEQLCKRYKLVTGLLSNYTGIIPSKNINEINNVKNKIDSFKGSINYSVSDKKYLWKIEECIDESLNGREIFNDFVNWIKSKNNFVFADRDVYNFDKYLWLEDMKKVNPDLPENVKQYTKDSLFKVSGKLVSKYTMFIACPPEQLKEQPLKITKQAIDPIVFQYSSYGIIIHSIWGEEAEDEVFEEYKKVNQLLSL